MFCLMVNMHIGKFHYSNLILKAHTVPDSTCRILLLKSRVLCSNHHDSSVLCGVTDCALQQNTFVLNFSKEEE